MASEADRVGEHVADGRRRTVPLSLTLAAVMAALVALTAVEVLAVFWLATARTTRELLAENATLAMDVVETRLHDRFLPVSDQLNVLAREFSRSQDRKSDGEVTILLTGAVAGTPQVTSLRLIKLDGTILGVRQGVRGVFPFTDIVRTGSEHKGLEEARSRKDIYMGSVYFVGGPAAGTSVVDLLHPVNDARGFLGVLAATITVDEPSRHLKAIAASTPGITPFVLYGRDRVLAHPNMVDIRASMSEEQPLPKLSAVGDPYLSRLWSDSEIEEIGEGDFEARLVRLQSGGRVILTRTMQGSGPVPMIIGVELPLSALEKPTSDLMRAGLTGVVVLLFAVLVAIAVSRAIARPVGAIAREVQAVGSLDFAALRPLPGSIFSELNEQARAYNAMLTGLRWFETYVPKSLVRRLVRSTDGGRVVSSTRVVTVMFTDIVGFTRTAETMSATDVADMLNAHFELLGRCVEAEGGTIDKFIGDSVMAFWGAPDDQPDHAYRALRAARSVAAALSTDNADRIAGGLAPIRIRMGIHSGTVVAGNIGTRDRCGYTIVGDTVNLGSRLEQFGKSLAPSDEMTVLLSGDTVALVADDKGDLQPLGPHVVSGRAAAIELFQLEMRR